VLIRAVVSAVLPDPNMHGHIYTALVGDGETGSQVMLVDDDFRDVAVKIESESAGPFPADTSL